jgi:hypothetical protein
MSAGEKVMINLADEPGASGAGWIFFAENYGVASFSVCAIGNGNLPLCAIALTCNQLNIIVSNDAGRQGGAVIVNSYISASMSAGRKCPRFLLCADYRGDGVVSVRVGNRLPVRLKREFKAFDFD